jgi:hypothetical protein
MQEGNVLNLSEVIKEQKSNVKRKDRARSRSKIEAEHKYGRTMFKFKMSLLLVVVIGVYWFADNYYLQSPVLMEFRSWYAKREPIKELVPVVLGAEVDRGSAKALTDEEKRAVIKKVAKYPVILAGVWFRESTNGKNEEGHHNYCEEIGYSNEFGFSVYGDNKKCFTSFEEAVVAVDSWFDEQLKKLSIDQALCLYNTGDVSDDCTYAHNYRQDEPTVWVSLNK